MREGFEADQAAAITADVIQTLDDERLDSWLWARTCKLAGNGDRSELSRLSPGVRMFLLTRAFEWEVGNGGIWQYVSNAVNNSGTQFDLVAQGYDLIGMPERARLVRTVASYVEPLAHMYLDDYEGDEPADDDDDEVDQHHNTLCELADGPRLVYVRTHPDEFAI